MITKERLIKVLDKEITFDLNYTAEGGSKKIAYNPFSKMTSLYINGNLHLLSSDLDEVINKYNSIK